LLRNVRSQRHANGVAAGAPQGDDIPQGDDVPKGDDIFEQEIEMTKNLSVVLYAVVMIAIVVGVDVLYL
jgi:hypothetical protein